MKSYQKPPPEVQESIPLPGSTDLPSPTTIRKALSMTFGFVSILFKEEEYRSFLYFVGGLLLLEIVLAGLCPPLRIPVLIFFVCSTIIIPILMLIVASRTGGMKGLSRRLRTGRDGGFGGRAGSI